MVDGEMITEPGVISRKFKKYFQSVFTSKSSNTDDNRIHYNEVSVMGDLILCQKGILNVFLNLDMKNVLAPIIFRIKLLRCYAEWVSQYLLVIFNASISQADLPSDWKNARAIPVHKRKVPWSVFTHRQISLMSACWKIL